MELEGKAGIAVLAGLALTTEKPSESDPGSSASAGPLRRTVPVFFMLFLVLVLADVVALFAAIADDSGFMPSELSSSSLCDSPRGGPLLLRGEKKS